MNRQAIHITDYDMKRLRILLESGLNWCKEDRDLVKEFKEKLDGATVISQKEVPPYLVTMNSHVRVTDLETQEDMDFWLAYPDDAVLGNHKVSVISELGNAILGSKVGDKVTVADADKEKQLRISRIYYQPEENKHYRL